MIKVLDISTVLVVSLGISLGLGRSLQAQIIPDATLGQEGSRLSPTVQIRGEGGNTRSQEIQRIDGGAMRGSFLFHSFSEFNIGETQRVYFANPAGIESILSRVTGTNVSNILGTLGVDGAANLFLLNPQGIVFGPNARLDMAGSFVATTGDRFTFADGSEFSAVDPQLAPLLTVATPVGLQYGSGQSGAIINAANLAVGAGRSLTLVGETVVSSGTLTAPGGQVAIASIVDAANVQLGARGQIREITSLAGLRSASSVDAPSVAELVAQTTADLGLVLTPLGTVAIAASGTVIPTASGDTVISGEINAANLSTGLFTGALGGQVVVGGDRVALVDQAEVTAVGEAGGGQVLIGGDYQGQGTLANAQRTYVGPDVMIDAGAVTAGDGGRVIIWGDVATDFYGHIQAQGGRTAGNGGFVEVSSPGALVFQGAVDTTALNGAVGTVLLDPTNILIVRTNGDPNATVETIDAFTDPDGTSTDPTTGQPFNGTVINAAVLENQAGNIVVQASNDIRVADGVSLNFFDPNGGPAADPDEGRPEDSPPPRSIQFTANADGIDGGDFIMDPTQSLTAKGSNLTISGANVTLGRIDTMPYFSVTPLELAANPDQMVIGRRAGSVTITATDGDIFVDGEEVFKLNTEFGDEFVVAAIETSAEVFNPPGYANGFLVPFVFKGAGGITLSAPQGRITVNGDLRAVANIRGFLSGDAGPIEIMARDDIEMRDNVRAYSYAGRGGSIDLISDRGSVAVRGSRLDSVGLSGVDVGGGGNILVIANRLNDSRVRGNVTIPFIESVSRTPIGRQASGNVTIIANGGGTVRTGDILAAQTINSAGAGGDSGEIRVEAPGGTVILDAVSYNAALEDVAGGAETPGIFIAADTIQLLNGASLNTSTLGSSDGGPITLEAQTIFFANGSRITTQSNRSATGAGGDIQITARETLTLGDRSFIDAGTVSDGAGGRIAIEAGAIALTDGSFLNTSTLGAGNAGSIRLTTTVGDVVLNDSSLFSLTDGAGNAGTITVQSAGALEINEDSVISTSVLLGAGGKGGNIVVDAPTGVLIQGTGLTMPELPTGMLLDGAIAEVEPNDGLPDNSLIASGITTQTLSSGRSGDITINAPLLDIQNGGQISTATLGGGQAGDINLQPFAAGADLTITLAGPGSQITASTLVPTVEAVNPDSTVDNSAANGNSGRIAITAPNSVTIQGDRNGRIAVETGSNGNGGELRLTTGTLTIDAGVVVSAQSNPNSSGEAGSIVVNATDRFTIQDGSILSVETQGAGPAGDVTINTPQLTVASDAAITGTATETAAPTSQGGSIFLNASTMDLAGSIGVFSETQGQAPAGILQLSPYGQDANLNIVLRNDAIVSASTRSSGDGGDLAIAAPDSISIQGDGRVAVETTGSGTAGTLRISAQNLTIDDGAILSAESSGRGQAGGIDLDLTGQLTLQGGSQISVSSKQEAPAGDLRITANQVRLTEQSSLSAETDGGSGANIALTVGDRLSLSDQSRISASTHSGIGGQITLNPNLPNATTTVRLSEGSEMSTEATGSGDAGLLRFNAATLNLNNSRISAATRQGNAGSITLNVRDSLTLSGLETSLSAQASQPGGTAGDIRINTRHVTVADGAAILASNRNAPIGGNIALTGLETLDLNNGQISAETRTGQAGNLTIQASDWVRLQNGSVLSVETRPENGSNEAGIRLLEPVTTTSPRIPTAGNLSIQTNRLDIEGGSEGGSSILVQSPNGRAGNINIEAAQVYLDAGIISASTSQNPQVNVDSATITIRGVELLSLANGSLISAQAQAGAEGGNINIIANNGYIVAPSLSNSDIIATAEQGRGGEINISADQLFGFTLQDDPTHLRTNQTNDISASSASGPQGIVNLNTLNVDPSQGIIELPTLLVEVPLLESVCNAAVRSGSEFVLTGRGGLPTAPTDLPSDLDLWEDWYIATPQSANLNSVANPSRPLMIPTIREAQGWNITDQDQLWLGAAAATIIPNSTVRLPLNCRSINLPRSSADATDR